MALATFPEGPGEIGLFPNTVAPPDEAGRWRTLRDDGSPASATFADLEITVPGEKDVPSQAARIHELLHVSQTERDIENSIEAAAVEDARVQHYLRDVFPPGFEPLDQVYQAQVAQTKEELPPPAYLTKEAIYRAVCEGISTFPSLASLELFKALKLPKGVFESLLSLLERIEEPDAQSDLRALLTKLRPAYLSEAPKPEPRKRRLAVEGRSRGRRRDPKEGNEPWGEMATLTPPLKRRIRAQLSRFVRGEFGALHRIERLLSDGLSFREKRRRTQGTVLVDCSGSMSINDATLARLVANVSAVTVGLYASVREDNDSGNLVIVARDGRMVEDVQVTREESLGGGNVVDVPALEWLARQARPRVWISDGGVTGRGDRSSEEVRDRCEKLRRENGIERVGSLADALTRFGLGERPTDEVASDDEDESDDESDDDDDESDDDDDTEDYDDESDDETDDE